MDIIGYLLVEIPFILTDKHCSFLDVIPLRKIHSSVHDIAFSSSHKPYNFLAKLPLSVYNR